MKEKGLIIILSGPSGSGKGTVLSEFMKTGDYQLSVSVTTREPRKGEVDGVNYHFKTKEEFEKMIHNNEFAEYVVFNDNYYGTLLNFNVDELEKGKCIIFEVEVQGALELKKKYPEAVMIFIVPPNIEILKDRLIKRGTDTIDVINERIETAKKEIMYLNKYDYVIINDKKEMAINELINIVNNEKKENIKCNEIINNFFKGDNKNA